MSIHRIILLLLLLAAAAPGRLHAGNFIPSDKPNPWADDYRNVARMDSCARWGTYNVHDPSCRLVDGWYYMYSTDAIFSQHSPAPGFIQVRRSRDLVSWEFAGWAFDEIPAEAVEWVHSTSGGKGATNIWAPYMIQAPDGRFRLYYCVSAFGRNTSYIGLAEADSPEGPWQQKGCVVKTDSSSPMNAIDPSVIAARDGKWWMHYGSFFGGLYCMELDPSTGLAATPDDHGHLIARRANYRKDNLEAPEIYYDIERDKYYLFTSYDPLMTTYNVRVARSDSPFGPFKDFFGKEIADTTDNFPILTAPYRFEKHPGWMGTAHCSVFTDRNGKPFMAHQGRYAEMPEMMDLHIRQIFFTPEGWPVVSPQRFTASEPAHFSREDLCGTWEIIRVHEPSAERNLEAGQILWGEGALLDGECNVSSLLHLAEEADDWTFNPQKQSLSLRINGEVIENLIIFAGHDWERQRETILFSGLDPQGRSVWGKRI